MQSLWIWVACFSFCVDFLLILGTNRLCNHKTVLLDACLASLLGSFQAAVCTVSEFQFLAQFHWRWIFLCLMCWVGFRKEADRLERSAMFVLLQVSVWELAKGQIWFFILAAAALCLLCTRCVARKSLWSRRVSVRIRHRGREVHLFALLDTGNLLRDPISGAPVLVVDRFVAWKLLGLSPSELDKPLETMVKSTVPGLRLIPYHSVGNPAGMLLGFCPELVQLDGVPVQQVVAFSPHKIGSMQTFQALAGGMV